MTADPVILAFDTAAAHCAAAVLSGGQVLAAEHLQMERGQGEHLFGVLESTLEAAGISWSDLTRLGVGIGPGNFTGIRISVAAARGLSMSLGIPAVGVSLLEALAFGTKGALVACLDARRDHVYIQVFRDGVPISEPSLTGLSDVPDIAVPPEAVAVGPAAGDVAARLGLIEVPMVRSPAIAIAGAAEAGRADPGSPPVPLYIRPPDAAPPRDPAPAVLGG